MSVHEFFFPYRGYGINQYVPWYRGSLKHQAHVREFGGPDHPWTTQNKEVTDSTAPASL
jgi:hypothetical protein